MRPFGCANAEVGIYYRHIAFVERTKMIEPRDTQREEFESANDHLLKRFLTNPRIGALLKGLGVFIKDYESGAALPNTLWKELGYGAADMSGDRWKRFVHQDDRRMVDDFSHKLQTGAADSWEGSFRIQAKSGEYHHIQHKALVLERNEQGTPTLLVGWDQDQTEPIEGLASARSERDLNERRFLQSETIRTASAILSSELDPTRAAERVLAQADRVVHFDSAALWTVDGDRLVRLASRAPENDGGETQDIYTAASLEDILSSTAPRVIRKPRGTYPAVLEIPLIVRGRVQGLIEFRSRRPEAFGAEEIGAAVQFADHAVVALANALRYRAAEIEAGTDWLTGLPTRRAFMSRAARLHEEYPPDHPLAALMIDIDRFKQVNDSFGHATGDAALRLIAKSCRDELRGHDLCGRYGGEEIVALLPGADGDTAFAVAERLRKRVEAIRLQAHAELVLTVSIGVRAGMAGQDFRELIERADEALYQAKAAGRNRCEIR